jgi:hypothetical protein
MEGVTSEQKDPRGLFALPKNPENPLFFGPSSPKDTCRTVFYEQRGTRERVESQ